MKSLLLLLALLSTSLMASEIKILELTEVEARWNLADIDSSIKVSEKFGTAWVDVLVYESSTESFPIYTKNHIVKVPGLSFDQKTSLVYLEHEGQLIECGKYHFQGRLMFRRKVVSLTERCQFSQKWGKKTNEEGETIKSYLITLIVE